MDDEIAEILDQQNQEEDLPVAMPLAVLAEDDAHNFVDAMLLNRHVQVQGSSFLYGMIQDQETACSNLGWGSRSCRTLCQRIQEAPEDVYYRDQRNRTPLHELCLRCPCSHVVNAIMDVSSSTATAIDDAGNTPLHLINHGFSTHALDPAEIAEILDRLLADPAASSVCNRDGNTVLHMACIAAETMLHLGSIQKLLQANRTNAARVNNHNQTPLNLHCQRRLASREVAALLIEAYPDAIRILDNSKGWSPLHYAASNANFELIGLILQQNHAAANLRSKNNETPLHVYLKKNTQESNGPAIQRLLEAEPTAVMIRESSIFQFTPLHLACKDPRVPLSIVASMLEVCPKAASVPDSNGYLPIHHACEVGTATEIIQLLLEVYREGALAKTKKLDSALALACSCNQSAATVSLLIEANPDALTEKNHYGFVPLHCVCAAVNPKISIVEEILCVCPSSVVLKSHGGETAMHISSGNPSTCVVVIELLTVQYESFTDGESQAEETNKGGSTPLHHACFRGSPFEHIETLAISNPRWIKSHNRGGLTPIMILCKNANLNTNVISTFFRIGGPGVFAVSDGVGNTPLHSSIRAGLELDALRCLIRAYPDALKMKTSYGDYPIHLTCFRRVEAEIVREVALSSSETILLTPNTAGQTPIGIAMEEFENVCKRGCSCCVKADYQQEQQRAFDVLATLVKILHYGSSRTDDRDKNGSLVKACISLHRRDVRLDPAFIRRALYLYPEEARLVDEDGNFPLHIEASIPVEKMSLLDSAAEASCSGNCHKRLGILRMLFDMFPDACRARNNAGEFPLGLMIKARGRWDQTMALILRKFPQALQDSVAESKLFPRILEKVARDCGVATLHQLIKSRPDIAMKSV